MVRSSHKIGEELKRKSFHVGFGLVALSFPVIWSENWMVVAGLSLGLAWMFAVRVLPCLRKYFGSVLHDCDRNSMGELYYAVSVAGLILVTRESPLLYVIPILILSLADAAAAVCGRLIPSQKLTGCLRGKSVAGCSAFFVVAATTCIVTLGFYTELPVWQIGFCAVVVATATCLAEAVCRGGLDNLVVPLIAWLALAALNMAVEPALTTATDFQNSISLLIGGAWQ
jgi:phytol kinase